LFTCNGRGTRLFSEEHHDARAVRAEAGAIPLAGVFAAGELGAGGGEDFMHGVTASGGRFEGEEPRGGGAGRPPASRRPLVGRVDAGWGGAGGRASSRSLPDRGAPLGALRFMRPASSPPPPAPGNTPPNPGSAASAPRPTPARRTPAPPPPAWPTTSPRPHSR